MKTQYIPNANVATPGEKKKRGVKTGALHDETGYWLSCLVAASATLKDNYLQGWSSW
jgi:hypothetical protein